MKTNKTTSILAIAGLVLALAPATQAADIELGNPLVPGGLGVGDTFQLVFVSSTTRDATSNLIDDYNTHVQNAANGVTALSGYTWKAIASTNVPLVNANANVSVTSDVYRVDGTLVSSAANFWSQTHLAGISITETGGSYEGNVWSGSNWEGWRNNSGLGTDGGVNDPKQSVFGNSTETGQYWAGEAGLAVQTSSLPFYAVSEVLTVVESSTGPSTVAITSITSLGGGNWELTLKGEPNTAYEFDSSTTLVFPGTPVQNLVQGAKGVVSGTNSEILTTDGSGDAIVQMSLGAVPANFVRAVGP